MTGNPSPNPPPTPLMDVREQRLQSNKNADRRNVYKQREKRGNFIVSCAADRSIRPSDNVILSVEFIFD